MKSTYPSLAATLMLALALPLTVLAQGAATGSKKDLAGQVIELHKASFENLSRALLQQTIQPITQQINLVMQQRVPPEQREALSRDIQGDMRKFFDESMVILREHAPRASQQSMGTLLEERMSADELKQLIATLKSPAWTKFQSLQGEMLRGFNEKLVADTREQITPKAQAMQQAIGQRLAPFMPAASGPR